MSSLMAIFLSLCLPWYAAELIVAVREGPAGLCQHPLFTLHQLTPGGGGMDCRKTVETPRISVQIRLYIILYLKMVFVYYL
jgi:hypothetical protein